MADLSTNYIDDILAESMNGKRKYRITRADGSFEEVTLEDVSEYEQRGSVFGAGDINRTNQAVNEKFDSGDVVDPMETTIPGFAADALAVKNQFNEQNKKFAELFVIDNFTKTDVSVSGGSVKDITFDVTKNGYTPICIAGFKIAGGQSSTVASCIIQNTNEVFMRLYYSYSSSIKIGSIDISVLYIKND